MTTSEIELLLRQTPFVPFRLILNDGGSISVPKPRKGNISGDVLAVAGIVRKGPKSAGVHGLNLVRIEEIVGVETENGDFK